MGSEIPEWAMEEARVALISHPGKYDPVLERVALALVAAERRGLERAAKTVDALSTDDLPDEFLGRTAHFGDAMDLAHRAIRQLGDTP